MEKKFMCAGVTLYNPEKKDIENLNCYAEIFEKVFVYDNTPCTQYLIAGENIEVISKGTNDGLGVACSELCGTAKKQGFAFIMLFDQDSRIHINDLSTFLEFIFHNRALASIYCPKVIYNDAGKAADNEYEFIDWCITSGSVINLGGYGIDYKFDNNYFIDRLDKDICEQVVRAGKKICQVNTVYLYQRLGEYGKNGYSYHKPFRHYYIARNRLYFNKKYKVSYATTILQIFNHIGTVLCHEPEKMNKIRMIFMGMHDFHAGKMGKKAD